MFDHFPSGLQWLVIAGIALLIWGRRLPEVGRSMGKGILEFKKGLKGVEDDTNPSDADTVSSGSTPTKYKFDPYTGKPVAPSLPAGAKFDPYTGKPLDQSADAHHSVLEAQKPNA